jgi:aerotaxis receptor
MRQNLPVTLTECTVGNDETLVSTTDLKGRITYCNPAFVTVSGYEINELLGQPHNLIRHPHMPEEAFRDMWDTIAKGMPWNGPVKNRRKDGSFYWVMANVTPLLAHGQPIGYMSVRTALAAADKEAAEALYVRMREERAAGRLRLVMRAGQLQRNDWRGRLTRLSRPGPTLRIALACLGAASVGPLSAAVASHGLGLAAPAAQGLGLLSALIAGATAAVWLHRQDVAPLQRLLHFANQMAGGDLSQTLPGGRADLVGQLQRALNQLNVNVRSIVRDARTEVEKMGAVTTEIASGNLELSSRTESQASSLEETASSMEQITGTVRQSAETARQVSAMAEEASQVTQRSSDEVHKLNQTMEAINTASRRIGEIIQVIDGIAFQTNILALNAAVEAARAGEQGRGFAVVAGEVRGLAQRSAQAAREIKQLVQDSACQVDAGAAQTRSAQDTMSQALAAVRRVGTLIAEVDGSAREQLLGISQINEAVTQLDTITQQNAAMVEELASSAASLQDQTGAVARSVRVFRLGGEVPLTDQADAVALRRAGKRAAVAGREAQAA